MTFGTFNVVSLDRSGRHGQLTGVSQISSAIRTTFFVILLVSCRGVSRCTGQWNNVVSLRPALGPPPHPARIAFPRLQQAEEGRSVALPHPLKLSLANICVAALYLPTFRLSGQSVNVAGHKSQSNQLETCSGITNRYVHFVMRIAGMALGFQACCARSTSTQLPSRHAPTCTIPFFSPSYRQVQLQGHKVSSSSGPTLDTALHTSRAQDGELCRIHRMRRTRWSEHNVNPRITILQCPPHHPSLPNPTRKCSAHQPNRATQEQAQGRTAKAGKVRGRGRETGRSKGMAFL